MMDAKNKSNQNASPSQRARFIEAARQLGADEDEAAFKAKLAAVARHKPKGGCRRMMGSDKFCTILPPVNGRAIKGFNLVGGAMIWAVEIQGPLWDGQPMQCWTSRPTREEAERLAAVMGPMTGTDETKANP